MTKERLDVLLMERGLAPSREKARAFIMAGEVRVNGTVQDKPGTRFDTEADVELRAEAPRYVSRGGLKLEKALQQFAVSAEGKVCLDVGASTGGFTDCLLQHGASKVYAVDVGYGQLAVRLRQDPRVISLERVHARDLGTAHMPEEVALATIDVSFISLQKVLPAVIARMAAAADVIALVKPQFEAGRRDASKGAGVIKDPQVHRRVLHEVVGAAQANGLYPCGLTRSPLLGAAGNVEFLLWARRTPPALLPDQAIEGALAC